MPEKPPRHEQTTFNQALGHGLLKQMIQEAEEREAKLKTQKPPEPEDPDQVLMPTPEEIEAREKKRLLLKQQAEMLGIKKGD